MTASTTPTPPADTDTLADARAYVRDELENGVECPCCRQFAKTYRRHIHAAMARDLIRVHRAAEPLPASEPWVYLPELLGHSGDFAKLRYWGLVDPQPGERDDGSTRTGWWRVTTAGYEFVLGHRTVPDTALIYDGRCTGFSDKFVSIRDCLGKRFSYDELMANG